MFVSPLTRSQHTTIVAWMNDLRTTKEKQAQHQLYDGVVNGYCCLGRLCEVKGLKKGRLVYSDSWLYSYKDEGNRTVLPESLKIELGLKSHSGSFEIETKHDSYFDALTSCNDVGMTFPQIADIIEYYLNQVEVVEDGNVEVKA